MITDAAWEYLKSNEGEVYEEPNGIPTKYGVEIGDYNAYLKEMGVMRQATKEDIENLTESGARLIYSMFYWDPLKLDEIQNPRVQTKLFDTAVKMGLTGCALIAQTAAQSFALMKAEGLKIDGIMGPVTRSFINVYAGEVWGKQFMSVMGDVMAGMIVQRVLLQPQYKADEAGWLARAFREPA